MRKSTMFILVMILAVTAFANADKYAYDFADPVSVVQAANRMLMNADYFNMTNITEGNERKKTDETLQAIRTDSRMLERLKKESEQIEGFEVIGTELYTNVSRAVVHTKWTVKVAPKKTSPYTSNEDLKKQKITATVYVDYMLKPFAEGWKIISKQTK